MGIHDHEITKHQNDVVDGLTNCDCKITEEFVWNGRKFSAVKFADECVNPQILIDVLTK